MADTTAKLTAEWVNKIKADAFEEAAAVNDGLAATCDVEIQVGDDLHRDFWRTQRTHLKRGAAAIRALAKESSHARD